MGEISRFHEILKSVVKIEQTDSKIPGFSPIFKFPHTVDYHDWMNTRLNTLPTTGFRWRQFYNEVINLQIKPSGIEIPSEWNKRLISYPTNCIYLIADETEKIVYVGKSEYPAIIRLLDRMMPKCSTEYPNGQQLNNIPQIWDDYLSKGRYVKCFFCYNLSFDPEILEYYLLSEFKIINGRLPIFNRKMPNSKFLPKVLEIRNVINL